MFAGFDGFKEKKLILPIKNSLIYTDRLDDSRAGNPLGNVLFPSEKHKIKAKQTPRMVSVLLQINLPPLPPKNIPERVLLEEMLLY